MSTKKELYESYDKKLDYIYKALYNDRLYRKDINELMRELYLELKKASIDFYENHQIDPLYLELIKKANLCELVLSQEYICDIKSNYDEKKLEDSDDTNFYKVEDILDFIVYHTRKYIENKANPFPFADKTEFDDIDVTNKCVEISKCVSYICSKINIKEKSIKLNPGFHNTIELFNGNGFHHFNFIVVNNKEYIVDCTYKQFFILGQNYLERLGTMCGCGCNPGIFMLFDESHAKTALTLIKNGWIQATEENIKNYLDGFALSNRNGLFCEYNHTPINITEYTSDNYVDMLFGKASQLDYEDRIWLGYQSRPIYDTEIKLTNKPLSSYCYIDEKRLPK